MKTRYARRIRRGIVLATTASSFLAEGEEHRLEGDYPLYDLSLKFANLNHSTAHDEHRLTGEAFDRVLARWEELRPRRKPKHAAEAP